MAVRKLVLCAILVMCLAIVVPAWAGTLQFTGTTFAGQGALSFNPGMGDDFTIGAGNGGQGALITDLVNNLFICNGDCAITGGYLTLNSGGETSGIAGGGSFTYTFGAGGQIQIFGSIPSHNINSALIFSAQFLPGGIFTGAGTIGSIYCQPQFGQYLPQPELGNI